MEQEKKNSEHDSPPINSWGTPATPSYNTPQPSQQQSDEEEWKQLCWQEPRRTCKVITNSASTINLRNRYSILSDSNNSSDDDMNNNSGNNNNTTKTSMLTTTSNKQRDHQ